MFVVMKRSKISGDVKSKMAIAALLGLMVTCFVIGVGKVGQYFVDAAERTGWLKDAETIHNLFIILALFSLILLAGYIFLLNYRKKTSGEQD